MQQASSTQKKTQIVIVGGGAAGLELARKLGARYGRKHHDIILVDRNRTHIWKPLLHEVAAGSLDASLDEVGYRSHCRRWGYRYLYGSLDGIDRTARRVHIAPVLDPKGREIVGAHSVRYDYLVLAYGSVTNDFGTPGVAENCLFLDSRTQADSFRDQLLDHCLRVSRAMTEDPQSDARVRIAIVGGGATGVELAAELYNAADGLSYYGLEVFDRNRLDVTLLEAGPRILPALPDRLAGAAHEELEVLGVKVMAGTSVTAATATGMETGNAGFVPADLMIWAAGVKAARIPLGLDGLELSRGDQIIVRPTLQSANDDRVFAIGDCASCTLPGRERPVPPRAQAAHQMADTAFHNLVRLQEGKPLRDFVYRDHGSLVSLSRFSTVGSLMGKLVGGRMAVEGRLARFVYLSLYRMHLLAVHGWLRGAALITVSHINRIVRPRLKLH
ncbi:MAG: NAD(P)/FAD-dependent oxidoreductase [Novosphingobium pentaromativorans]|uniref:NAD(P)/FAD-dependent oxidoreductase n=1 Tax=Novosphingobium pentaromativorans TaxID=205844 RepID=A0A2W5NSH3_9SPHN|nr:NAD(P)/FAD-dependent oxidoreductase [Novosphingobium panipatense]PZQ56522.1 MAG: NAD(P)/FAD-dependent oxidoreductase [Novosphingobium pentaromativorans]